MYISWNISWASWVQSSLCSGFANKVLYLFLTGHICVTCLPTNFYIIYGKVQLFKFLIMHFFYACVVSCIIDRSILFRDFCSNTLSPFSLLRVKSDRRIRGITVVCFNRHVCRMCESCDCFIRLNCEHSMLQLSITFKTIQVLCSTNSAVLFNRPYEWIYSAYSQGSEQKGSLAIILYCFCGNRILQKHPFHRNI